MTVLLRIRGRIRARIGHNARDRQLYRVRTWTAPGGVGLRACVIPALLPVDPWDPR